MHPQIKTKWYQYPIKWLWQLAVNIVASYVKIELAKREQTKQKLRYFNPVIKKDFLGNNKIEWIGRDKPLTDEQLEQLTYK